MYKNIQELAEAINGREYREEITKEESLFCKENNWVVLFWASDDLLEIRWKFYDEVWAWNWTKRYLYEWDLIDLEDTKEEMENWDVQDSIKKLVLKEIKTQWVYIVAKRWFEWYSFYIDSWITGKKKAAFDILEDWEKYCRGIVLDLS